MRRTLDDGAWQQFLTRSLGRPPSVAPITRHRQPIHVVYGGAHLFSAGTPRKLGQLARRFLDETLAASTLVPGAGAQVWDKVRAKLEREPVEDLRIDFEDGYGVRDGAEEDAHAVSAANAVADAAGQGVLPPFIGIRIKPISGATGGRALRTLDLFLSTLADRTSTLPAELRVTLPKVETPHEIVAVADAVDRIVGRTFDVRLEAMIETPAAVVDASGRLAVRELALAHPRLLAIHVGSYDLTGALGIAGDDQTLQHPACDFAKQAMLFAVAGTQVQLSDGATSVLPVPRFKAATSEAEREQNRAAIERAVALHASNVRHGLAGGFFQGWDLHPAQIPVRLGVVYAFFLAGLEGAANRWATFVERHGQAMRTGEVFDDAATVRGLENFFRRGLDCGAFDPAELASRGVVLS